MYRRGALDLIRNELEPYIKDDRIHSATRVITGGHGRGSPVKDILTNVLRRAIVDGPDAAAQAFAECVTGSSCTYYVYSVLTGIQVSQEVEIFQQIKPNPTTQLSRQPSCSHPDLIRTRAQRTKGRRPAF